MPPPLEPSRASDRVVSAVADGLLNGWTAQCDLLNAGKGTGVPFAECQQTGSRPAQTPGQPDFVIIAGRSFYSECLRGDRQSLWQHGREPRSSILQHSYRIDARCTAGWNGERDQRASEQDCD